jgi:hypothetical protein
MREGVVIFDNSSLRHFLNPDVRKRVKGSMRAAHLIALPSEINLIEAMAAPNAIREQLLELLRWLGQGRVILPWTFQFLIMTGRAILAGDESVTYRGGRGLERFLHPSAVTDAHSAAARKWMAALEERFTDMHEEASRKIRPQLRERGLVGHWQSARQFLDEYWNVHGMREHFAEIMWRTLKLPGAAPVAKMLETEAWRIALDVEGFAVFERAVSTKKRKKVHRPEMLELAYLATSDRRIIVADDRGFVEAATDLLRGRFLNARAMHVSEFIALAA